MKPSEYNPEVGYYQKEEHEYYDVFLKAVPHGARVIELGCGNGGLLIQLKKRGCTVAGSDISSFAEKKCKQKGIKFFKADIEKEEQLRRIPFNDYEIVVMAAMLEHMVDPKRVLRLLASVLGLKQTVLIGVPSCSDLIHRLRILRGDCVKRYGETKKDLALGIQPEGHLQFFNPKTLKHLVYTAGFKVSRTYYQSTQNLRPFWLRWLYKINHPLFKPFFVVECHNRKT